MKPKPSRRGAPQKQGHAGIDFDPVRDAAIRILIRVFNEGAYLNIALDKALERGNLSERGRRFLTQIVYGTVRHAITCDYILAPILNQPLLQFPPAIHAILRMAVFQGLYCAQVTRPAMVHTSVDLARKYTHAGLAKLVNAVLRRVPATLEDVAWPDQASSPTDYLSARYAMPRWMVERWLTQDGFETAQALCEAYLRPAPATIRANTLRITPEDLEQRMSGSGFSIQRNSAIPELLTILDGPPPNRSQWSRQGLFMQEDPASLLVPHLLGPAPGHRILDLCAAPGVKTTHIAQLAQNQASIAAVDIHPGKLQRILENAQRLGIEGIHCVCANGANPPFKPPFDRILIDAPCSGLGTLRHRPDLKYRATPETPARMAVIQQSLLRSALDLCQNGGVIVYSVCTFTPEETDAVVDACLSRGGVQAENGPEWMNPWRTTVGRYRTDPRNEGWDAFFLTRLRKVS